MDTNEHTSWRLAIGDLFTPERTHWPDNRFELRYFDGSFLLQICEASPSEKSIAAFRHGAMHIGLHYEQGVIFFLFRIDGTWAWSDQAFSIHLLTSSPPSRFARRAAGRAGIPAGLGVCAAEAKRR